MKKQWKKLKKNKFLLGGIIIGIIFAFGIMLFHNMIIASVVGSGGGFGLGILVTALLMQIYCPNLPSQGATNEQIQACIRSIEQGPLSLAILVFVACVVGGFGLGWVIEKLKKW